MLNSVYTVLCKVVNDFIYVDVMCVVRLALCCFWLRAGVMFIFRALFMEPTLLMLDEPTNHLDLNAVIWLDK